MEFKKQKTGENKTTKSEREINHKKLLIIGNKLRVAGGEKLRDWGNWVRGHMM